MSNWLHNDGWAEIVAALILMFAVTFNDFFTMGLRGFYEFSIGYRGTVVLWIAIFVGCYGAYKNGRQWK